MPRKKKIESKQKWLDVFERFIHYLRIDSKESISEGDKGSKLNLWTSQRIFLHELCEGLDNGVRTFYCLKARQLGVSTVSLAITVFWMAMHSGTIGALVTDTEGNREVFRSMIRRYIESFPKGFFGEAFTIVKGGDNRNFMRFSNGSRLDFIVAGTRKKATWGEGRGYAFCHLTEIANYGDPEGLNSFRETLAETNPNRLFIYESTAKGPNHWKAMWEEAGRDVHTKKRIFIGWWSKDINVITEDDPRWKTYGSPEIQIAEQEMIDCVKTKYKFEVNRNQLAWYRWRSADVSVSDEALRQNTPWDDSQAFVDPGYSFFNVRQLHEDLDSLWDNNPFRGFVYWAGNDFHTSKMDEIFDAGRIGEVTLRVWENPVADAQYAIGCDPAYGRNDNKDRHCLDDKTEILTKNGWKKYDEIKAGDQAVCFDLESEKYSYGKIKEVIVDDYDGAMHRITSKGLDSLVTPNHRVVNRCYAPLRSGDKSRWRFHEAREIAIGSNTVREIPVGGSPMGSGVSGLSLDMCRALGWILTDGHVRLPKYTGDGSRKGQKEIKPSIVLVQSIETVKAGVNISEIMAEKMRKLCPTSPIKIRKATDGNKTDFLHCGINVKESEKFIHWLGKNTNRIPRKIMEDGSPQQLNALFQGILDGDGGWDKANGNWIKVCPGLDSDFADDVQELAAKLGYSATKAVQKGGVKNGKKFNPQWLIRLSVRKGHTFYTYNIKKEDYSGKVWCVSVPTGAFVARRNGKMFVTGNSISVWRCYADKFVQVAEYADNNVETRQCAWMLASLAAIYKNSIVNVELTGGPGKAVMQEFDSLRERMRTEMYVERTKDYNFEDFMENVRWYIYHRPDTFSAGFVKGWDTNSSTKFWLCNSFRDSYLSKLLVVRSVHLIQEMLNVVQGGQVGGSDIGAVGTNKDDRVFAAIMAHICWTQHIRPRMIAEGYTYESVSKHESGESAPTTTLVNNIVRNFFRRSADREENEDKRPRWLVERGLI